MSADFRAWCETLAGDVQYLLDCLDDGGRGDAASLDQCAANLSNVLAALASAPPAPAAGEVGGVCELADDLREQASQGYCEFISRDDLRRAAALLEQLSATPPTPQPVPVPVAVSDRLPGVRDCAPWPGESDASAWCWVGSDVDGGWSWEQRSAGCLAAFPDDFTHWLPAHAMPIPTTTPAGQEGA